MASDSSIYEFVSLLSLLICLDIWGGQRYVSSVRAVLDHEDELYERVIGSDFALIWTTIAMLSCRLDMELQEQQCIEAWRSNLYQLSFIRHKPGYGHAWMTSESIIVWKACWVQSLL